jgi:hypothetical protein
MIQLIIPVTVLMLGSLAGHFVVRRAVGPEPNFLLQWIGGFIGATCAVIFSLVLLLVIDPPEVFDPAMLFAQVAPAIGAVAATVEVVSAFAMYGDARSKSKTMTHLAIMLGIACLCISWLVYYETQLNHKWESPPAPVPMRMSDNK